jgi:crotonobetainyl-CoA:carnitine CoA-transferase CaiB-like acyl-CoA transferase
MGIFHRPIIEALIEAGRLAERSSDTGCRAPHCDRERSPHSGDGCMTIPPNRWRGLKVLDFGHTIMGPCAGVVFADLGADVVQDRAGRRRSDRRIAGFAAGFFATYNRNKRSIAIDLKRSEGQANRASAGEGCRCRAGEFRPGHDRTAEMQLGGSAQINPRLVYLSMKGFLKGPYENRGALDEGGADAVRARLHDRAAGPAVAAGAPSSTSSAACSAWWPRFSASRARRHRHRAEGREFAVRKRDLHARRDRRGQCRDRRTGAADAGTQERLGRVRRLHRFRRGQVFIGCTSDGHGNASAKTFGFGDWRDDPRLAGNTSGARRAEWMLPELERRITKLPLNEILEKCEAARVAYSRVGRPDELSDDPHLLPMAACSRPPSPDWAADRWSESPRFRWSSATGANAQASTASRRKVGEHAIEILSAAG